MNTDILTPVLANPQPIRPDNLQDRFDFLPIESPDTGLPLFARSMLMIGKIITAKHPVVREMTANKIHGWMHRHHSKIAQVYRPLQIRKEVRWFGGELRGGGVKIEWNEYGCADFRATPHYLFTFSRILKPEDYLTPEVTCAV